MLTLKFKKNTILFQSNHNLYKVLLILIKVNEENNAPQTIYNKQLSIIEFFPIFSWSNFSYIKYFL